MFLQRSQTSLRTTAATRSFQCCENIRYAAAGNTPTVFQRALPEPSTSKPDTHFYLMQLKPGVCITETIAPPRDLEILQVSQKNQKPISSQVSKDLANVSALIHHTSICQSDTPWTLVEASSKPLATRTHGGTLKAVILFIKTLQDQVQPRFINTNLLMCAKRIPPPTSPAFPRCYRIQSLQPERFQSSLPFGLTITKGPAS